MPGALTEQRQGGAGDIGVVELVEVLFQFYLGQV